MCSYLIFEVYDYDETRGHVTVRLIPRLDLVAWERRQRGEAEDGDEEERGNDENEKANKSTKRKKNKQPPPAKFFNPEEIRVRIRKKKKKKRLHTLIDIIIVYVMNQRIMEEESLMMQYNVDVMQQRESFIGCLTINDSKMGSCTKQ
jgi:hypothetical protein